SEFGQGPVEFDGELALPDHVKSGLCQHLDVGPELLRQLPVDRNPALSAERHSARIALKARCQSASPENGWDDQHTARCPPGFSHSSTRPATRSRSSRWNALPIVARSNWSGSAFSVSALDTMTLIPPAFSATALAWTRPTMSGSWSTAQTSPNHRRSAKASCPVPQARSSRQPSPEIPARRTRSWIISSGYR